ncbi:UNVERIFIED_CONTAM: hypothetical protein Slati_2781600 [Sesamum latifolium]|uniref:SWIM-type domain-containing protein n=1 Tax=Sesamum latifolium TaxID=2727402 RepID=A0AAW2VYM7_9LAMI
MEIKNRDEFDLFVVVNQEGGSNEVEASVEPVGVDCGGHEGENIDEGVDNESGGNGHESGGNEESMYAAATVEESDDTSVSLVSSDNDHTSGYKYDDHCEAENLSDEEFCSDPMKGKLSRDACVVHGGFGDKIKLEQGMIFTDIVAFRDALMEYVIQEGFKIMKLRNERVRVIAHCAVKDYPWRVHASILGSVVTLQSEANDDESIPATPMFKKFFLGLSALGDEFVEGCSPFLGFDECHLKGPFGGVLLTAIGLDENNELYPVAFVVAESECKESWMFFFENLANMLDGFSPDLPWTFMSDRQKASSKKEAKEVIAPNVVKLLNNVREESRKCSLLMVGEREYEVNDVNVHCIVNLRKRTCDCKFWEIVGIPCRHAALGIAHRREEIENYTDVRFS